MCVCVCVCFGSDGDILVTECNPAHYTHVTYCIGIYGGEAEVIAPSLVIKMPKKAMCWADWLTTL